MATGWDNGLCQDYCRGLSLWFSSRLDARHTIRKHLMPQPNTQAPADYPLWLAHEHMRLYLSHYTPGHNVYDTVSAALASQPAQAETVVPVGWIAFAERMPPEDAALDNPKCKTRRAVLVTNNLEARDRMGRMSHVWWAAPIASDSGDIVAFTDANLKIMGLTHWFDPFATPPQAQPAPVAVDEREARSIAKDLGGQAARSGQAVASVKKTAGGPILIVNDVNVRSWLGCSHDDEANAMAERINAARSGQVGGDAGGDVNNMRIALVTQVHELISTLEQVGATHHDHDARRQAEGCIRFARYITDPFNYNGPYRGATTPQPAAVSAEGVDERALRDQCKQAWLNEPDDCTILEAYDRGWKDGYKHGAWAAAPAAPVQAGQGVGYSEQQVADACAEAEISDAKCESLLIALAASKEKQG